MTSTALGQNRTQGSRSMSSPERSNFQKSQSVHLHPTGDSASDGDAGERPVREKLKKTSIASIPKYGIVSAEMDAEGSIDTEMDSQHTEEDRLALGLQSTDTGVESTKNSVKERGRAVRKRSLETLDTVDNSKGAYSETSTGAHARKRSRDVRSGRGIKSESPRRSPGDVLGEENEEVESGKQASALRQDLEETTIEENTPKNVSHNADQDMQGSYLSPKKKRSRDQFDESQREQKIAATDENRRRRSSEEERRTLNEEVPSGKLSGEQSFLNGHVVVPKDTTNEVQTAPLNHKIPAASGFGNTSAISPFATFAGSKSVFGRPAPTPSNITSQQTQTQTQTTTSAFTSSGFAALAGSSTAPFGSATTLFQTHEPTSPPQGSRSAFATVTTSESSGFGVLAGAKSGGFGGGPSLTFASSNSSGFGILGGTTFGGGFGTGFAGGSKLSGFAAPTADVKLGEEAKAKAFGAPTGSDDEDCYSDAYGSSAGEEAEEREVESSRFQFQEVETGEEGEDTIFQNRAKLLVFQQDEVRWVERGVGQFKLNITRKDLNDDDTDGNSKAQARFIMRTQQTHKVILNAPILKEMELRGQGQQGDEPSGKSVTIPVFMDGKVVLHLLKMGKEEDIKTLYREVQKLRKEM